MSKIGRHWACSECPAGSGAVADDVNVRHLAQQHLAATNHFVVYSLKNTEEGK